MAARITAPMIRAMKGGEKIAAVTAYDAATGAIADASGVDLVLVGDSVGTVVLGHSNTISVTLDDMVHHVRATATSVHRALLVADLPFGSYGASVEQATDAATRLMRAGAQAVKLEGTYVDEIRALVKMGVPTMGHVGMTPQSVNVFGGHKVQGRGSSSDDVLLAARQIEAAGAFAIVLELVPIELSVRITRELSIPTIGIGAGPHCDGQVQVLHDMLGIGARRFKHAKRYIEGFDLLKNALERYAQEVKQGAFPTEEHGFEDRS